MQIDQIGNILWNIVAINRRITLHKSRHIKALPHRSKIFQPRSVSHSRTHPTGLLIIHITIVKRAIIIFPICLFLTQPFGKLPHTPVLISKKQGDSTPLFMHSFPKNFFRDKPFGNIILHKSIGRPSISGIIPDTTRFRVLQTPFVSRLYIEIPNAFVIGSCDQRHCLVSYHHIGIVATTRPTCNHPAITIIIHQCRDKLTHDSGISDGPQDIEVKFRTPKPI